MSPLQIRKLIARALFNSRPKDKGPMFVQWILGVSDVAYAFADCEGEDFDRALFFYWCDSGDVSAEKVKRTPYWAEEEHEGYETPHTDQTN